MQNYKLETWIEALSFSNGIIIKLKNNNIYSIKDLIKKELTFYSKDNGFNINNVIKLREIVSKIIIYFKIKKQKENPLVQNLLFSAKHKSFYKNTYLFENKIDPKIIWVLLLCQINTFEDLLKVDIYSLKEINKLSRIDIKNFNDFKENILLTLPSNSHNTELSSFISNTEILDLNFYWKIEINDLYTNFNDKIKKQEIANKLIKFMENVIYKNAFYHNQIYLSIDKARKFFPNTIMKITNLFNISIQNLIYKNKFLEKKGKLFLKTVFLKNYKNELLSKEEQKVVDEILKLLSMFCLSHKEMANLFKDNYHLLDFFLVKSFEKRGNLDIKLFEEHKFIFSKTTQDLIHNALFLNIKGIWVFKNRKEIIQYLIKSSLEERECNAFLNKYRDTLKQYNLQNQLKYQYSDRIMEQYLSTSLIVLSQLGKKFRYYNIASYNYSLLFKILRNYNFKNIEISTYKTFYENLAIMEHYNVKNEYELHNLLKKICTKGTCGLATFARIPNITFGNFSRKKQVIDILNQFKIISLEDLQKEYKKRYGVLEATFVAHYSKYLKNYLVRLIGNKIYYKKHDSSNIIKNTHKDILNQDFYLLNDLLTLLDKKAPYLKSEREKLIFIFNKEYNISQGKYVFSSKYKNLLEFISSFSDKITKNGILDFSQTELKIILKTNTFRNITKQFRDRKKLVKVGRGIYFNLKYLEEMMPKNLEKIFSNEMQIIESHLNERIESVESIFSSDLTKNFQSKNLNYVQKVLLLNLKFKNIYLNNNMDWNMFVLSKRKNIKINIEFLEQIIFELNVEKIHIEELEEILNNKYKINTKKDVLIKYLSKGSAYYNLTTKLIYKSKDAYMQKIKEPKNEL